MSSLANVTLNLVDFLQQADIDDSPAWEYLAGKVVQKPMPKAQHSRLQLKLAFAINETVESPKIAAAFPELRCTFGDRSLVPDITVLLWKNIPFNSQGELENMAIAMPPDWTIEILSPNQRSTKVIDNILYCLDDGCALGWLIEPEDRTILVFRPEQNLRIYRGDDCPPILPEIPLKLTVNQIFHWLTFG